MKKYFLAAVFFLGAISSATAQAPADSPSLDIVSPLAAPPDAPKPSWLEYKDPYAIAANDLTSANRTSDEIISWGQKAAAEALSFDAGQFNESIRTDKRFFMKEGWVEYTSYLKDSKILGVAQSNKYYINTIVDGTPMILNSGSLNHVFRWVVRIPIITTVNEPDAAGELKPISSSKIKIDMMISRVNQGGVDGLAIEKWRANVSDDKSVTK